MDLTKLRSTLLPDNYIYISHLDQDHQFWLLPCSPESIQDNMGSNFQSTSALGRSAPVFTYSNSGPRTVQVSLVLHRDMMDEINTGLSNSALEANEDYVDNLIKALQAIAVPKYNLSNKAVEPPLVAVRFSEEVFIKGVVNGDVGVVYKLPILYNNKYAVVEISFSVTEVDPYDATTVFANGSFRGMVKTLKTGMFINE